MWQVNNTVNLGEVLAVALWPQLLQGIPNETGLHIVGQVLAFVGWVTPLEIPAAKPTPRTFALANYHGGYT